jgi:hypothetical protein
VWLNASSAGFNFKGVELKSTLEAEKPNGICYHKINLADIKETDKKVIDWIRMAFDNAGKLRRE